MESNIQSEAREKVSEKTSQTLFRLIYRSRSKIPKEKMDEALGEILRVARVNNASRGITGALVWYDNWFAQVLEGDEVEIQKLFDVIKTDLRHSSIEVYQQTRISGRTFARWAMANVGEHGSPDVPVVATTTGTTEGAPWRLSEEQEHLVLILRNLTRGYGAGS